MTWRNVNVRQAACPGVLSYVGIVQTGELARGVLEAVVYERVRRATMAWVRMPVTWRRVKFHRQLGYLRGTGDGY